MARILLVEDDPAVAHAATLGLQRLGHEIRHELDGSGDLRSISADRDVVLLDLGLPGDDGFEICRRLRTFSTIPIIILTARDDDIDTVAGLESGADDYVVKPVTPRVLDARIKAVLRRTSAGTGAHGADTTPAQTIGNLHIDRDAHEIRKNGEVLPLSPTEFRLIVSLADNVGRVLSRQQLLRTVWEQDYLGDSRLVDTAVQRLRGKIEDDPATPTLIETIRGFGYRINRL